MLPSPPSAVIDFLNLLLECERAGAKALRTADGPDVPDEMAPMLVRHFTDEARYCAGLQAQIIRLGGIPTTQTGAFLEKFIATEGWPAKIALLIRGQQWVAKRIGEQLPLIDDPELEGFLVEMHATHLANVTEIGLAGDSA